MNDDQEKREGESPTGSSGGFLFLEIYQLTNCHFWSDKWGAPQGLDPASHGKIAAIDVDSGSFILAEDTLTASDKLLAAQPQA